MSGIEIFQIWVIAFFTVALLSFLYKDNPVYRLAEHIFAGLSAGYYVGLIWDTVILQTLWNPMIAGRWLLIIPGLLGVLMFARFSSKYAWLSRTPLAFVMAVTAGIFLISQLHGLVLPQTRDTMIPKTEAIEVVVQGYDDHADRLMISDSSTVGALPVQDGGLTLSKSAVSRLGGDSVFISTDFTDIEQPSIDMIALTIKLRAPDDKTQKPAVLLGTVDTPGMHIVDHGGGSYTAGYYYHPDTIGAYGLHDISIDVYRVEYQYWLSVLILIGVISTLVYFYFSKEHTGVLGATAQVGIWFIMIAFGAHFGYTVMGRVSLLIGRVQFLIEDWLGSFSHIF